MQRNYFKKTHLTQPVPIHRAIPKVPDWVSLRVNNTQGSVVVCVLVRITGKVGAVHVALSSGDPILDKAAIEAAEATLFRPATRKGRPVDMPYELFYDFNIQ